MHSIVHTRACCKALYTMIALCRRRLQYGRRRLLQVGPTRAKLREHAIVSISRVDERHMYVSRHFYRSEGTIAISYFLAPRQYFSTLEAEKIVRGTRCERIMDWQHRTASSDSQHCEDESRSQHYLDIPAEHVTPQTTLQTGSPLPKTMLSRPLHSFT